LADHIHLGDRAVVGAQAGVMRNLEADEVVVGSPAVPRKLAMQLFASEVKLPEMRRDVRKLQKELDRLQAALAGQHERTADAA
jgi:UDP-3-O-[3-hydroxymyristoyl] glucosamine N-acyltransferase